MAKKPKVDNPSDPVAWCQEASKLLENDDYKGAAYCYQESLKLRPSVPDVWFNLACIYDKLGGKDAAIQCLLSCSKMFPGDYRFTAEHARLLAESGRFEEAVNAVDEALKINPQSHILLSNKAGYLLFLHKNEEALELTDSALAIYPAYIAAILHKAHALVNLGRMDDSLQVLLATPQDDSRILKMITNIYLRQGNASEGLKSAEKLVEMTPNDDQAWSLLGSARAYANDKKGASDAFMKAIKLNPKEKSYKENLLSVKKM